MKRLIAVLLALVLALSFALPILATEETPVEEPGLTAPEITAQPTFFAKIVDVVGTLFVGILASPLILFCIVIFFGAFAILAILASPLLLLNWFGGLFR